MVNMSDKKPCKPSEHDWRNTGRQSESVMGILYGLECNRCPATATLSVD